MRPNLFSQPEKFWIKAKACFRRFQNSPAAPTVGIADLQPCLDLITKIFPDWLLKAIRIHDGNGNHKNLII
ncbi:MAG TPA: hypothetical protein PKZ12_05415 [Smithellaceae bacterium]|nr:hypothetical protein [Smithellaceae bacterium]